jgi:MFS family permease
MTTNIDLKELERNAFKSTYQDGIWDIYLGLMLLPMVIWLLLVAYQENPSTWAVAFTFGFCAVPFFLFRAAKKHLVMPRLGLVQFGVERQRKRRKLGLAMSLSVLGTAVIVLITAFSLIPIFDNLPEWAFIVGLVGVKLVIVFSLIAYFNDFPRAYLYGWFYALSIVNLFTQIDKGSGVPILPVLFAGLMIALGTILLIQFLRDHPLTTHEVQHG